LKSVVTIALQSTDNEQTFKRKLAEQGINVVVRRNDTDRIYGITFIDHNSRTVWNGSRLGKELSANIFNVYWNNNKPEIKDTIELSPKLSKTNEVDFPQEEPHFLFDFLNTEPRYENRLIETLGGIIPDSQGEDYEEQKFAKRMMKRKKNK